MKGAKLPMGGGMYQLVEVEADAPPSFLLRPGWGQGKKELPRTKDTTAESLGRAALAHWEFRDKGALDTGLGG